MSNSIEAALTHNYTHPIRDVLWGHVYMTEKLAALTESLPFIRLNRIMQLGPVYLVYPGATHTRASHSIGVYHLGRRLLQNLAQRGASEWLSPQGVKSFLAACLLHDLGHFPYTHSLKELSLSSHEALTGAIILKEPMKKLVGEAGGDPHFSAAIVDKEMPGGDCELLFYRKLLSGALDPDKLDYLNRDAWYCGVPYGAQDVDFIMSRLHPNKERGVDIDSRLIPNVESILFSKYLMYRTVYWHRQVRAATAMVKKALIGGLESGKLKGEDLYNLDDMSLFTLISQKIDNQLVESVREGRIFTTAAEIRADRLNIGEISAISSRAQYEEKLARKLRESGVTHLANIGAQDIIIDIPEPVSFETGLFVSDEDCTFGSSSSAFKPETVDAFVKTLYSIRVYINQKYGNNIKTFAKVYDIMKKIMEQGD